MRARRFCRWGSAAEITARRWSGGGCAWLLGMGRRLLRRSQGVDRPGGDDASITTNGRGDRGDSLVTLQPAERCLTPPLHSHSVPARPLPAHRLRAGEHTAHEDAVLLSRVVHSPPVIRSSHTRRCIFFTLFCVLSGRRRCKRKKRVHLLRDDTRRARGERVTISAPNGSK